MLTLKVKTKHLPKDTAEMLRMFNLETGGLVQQAINNAVIRYDMDYVPMDTGLLMQSPYLWTDLSGTEVVYDTPYAAYQYYGLVMTDRRGRTWVNEGEKKPVITDRPLQHKKDLHPLAGPYWFERMKADHLNDIVEEAKAVAVHK